MVVDLHRDKSVLTTNLCGFLNLERQHAAQEVGRPCRNVGVIGGRQRGGEEAQASFNLTCRHHEVGRKEVLDRERPGDAQVKHLHPSVAGVVGSHSELQVPGEGSG